MSVLVGLLTLIWRRLTNERLKMVTTRMDIAVELLLLSQIIMGCWIALGYRWGSSWFASDLTPYLWSLFKLQPETAVVFVLPWIVKLHIFGAFLIVFMVPFSRLIHFVVIPLHYLTRPHQVVMWNWDRLMIRNAKSPWTRTRPKNN
jgi:nitrate reductase gamma subunit